MIVIKIPLPKYYTYPTNILTKELFPNFTSNINPLSTNITKWSNTLEQFVANLPMNCLSVFDHFVILALKGLSEFKRINFYSP